MEKAIRQKKNKSATIAQSTYQVIFEVATDLLWCSHCCDAGHGFCASNKRQCQHTLKTWGQTLPSREQQHRHGRPERGYDAFIPYIPVCAASILTRGPPTGAAFCYRCVGTHFDEIWQCCVGSHCYLSQQQQGCSWLLTTRCNAGEISNRVATLERRVSGQNLTRASWRKVILWNR